MTKTRNNLSKRKKNLLKQEDKIAAFCTQNNSSGTQNNQNCLVGVPTGTQNNTRLKTAFVHSRPVVARVASMLRLEQFPRPAGEAILNLLKTPAIIFPNGAHGCSS